jgi:hypothetical protein
MKNKIILYYFAAAVAVLIFSKKSFSQNVGIGTVTPTEKLHIAGNIKSDTIKANAIKLTNNAGAGKILTSDATGNANWQTSSVGGSVGFGPWGDCSTNAIGEYNPVADTTGAASDFFGRSVSISGNYVIVGSYADNVGANADLGSASFFQFNGANWVAMQKTTDPAGSLSDFFGVSVSVSGNYAIVRAFADDVGANVNNGSSTIYQRMGMGWTKLQYVTDPAGNSADFLGIETSIDGTNKRFLVGAYGYANSSGKTIFGKIN